MLNWDDRESIKEFIKQNNRKHQNDISQIEDKIISMYAKGMTVRDIRSHLEEIYGAEISSQTISNMTDRVLPKVEAYKCPILVEVIPCGSPFRDRIDHKKTFP